MELGQALLRSKSTATAQKPVVSHFPTHTCRATCVAVDVLDGRRVHAYRRK
jgi:hypothetical protein